MDIKEKKTVDMLTQDSVSILTEKYIEIDGVETKIGDKHRKAYQNSEAGRDMLQSEQPAHVVTSVLAIWGDKPTILENNENMEEQ